VSAPLVVAEGVVKGYPTSAGYLPVLQGLDLEVGKGEMLAITGASGVGKSTLLHVLGTLDRPEQGRIAFAGEEVLGLPESRLREFRNQTLGFVFQFHHLLPEFTALENVMMPLLIGRVDARTAREKARPGRRRAGSWPSSGSWSGPTTGRAPSPAGSSSGWRWPAPWPARPRPCSRTSPPGT
jgi:lipoprotein-releasing system ATP-binding protein